MRRRIIRLGIFITVLMLTGTWMSFETSGWEPSPEPVWHRAHVYVDLYGPHRVIAAYPPARSHNYGSVRHSTPPAVKPVAPKKKAPPPKKRPPSVLDKLPDDSIRTEIGGITYFRHGETWYERAFYGGRVRYLRVKAPVGLWLPQLPYNYDVEYAGDETYYVKDGICYKEGKSPEGKPGYVVILPPEKGPAPVPGAPDAFGLLTKMSETLAKAERFSFVVTDTMDAPLPTGHKEQLTMNRRFHVERPGKLQVDSQGDIGVRKIYYDGKTFTLFDPKHEAYSEIGVPGTIDAMLDYMAQKYGLAFPASDFLYSNAYDGVKPVTKTGHYLGLSKVGETECHHLAFEAHAADWQLWIDTGENPLPRKVVIKYKMVEGSPRYAATFQGWNLKAGFSPELFEFKPPPGAEKLKMLSALEGGGQI